MRNISALLTTSAAVGYAGETSQGTEIVTGLGRIVFGSPFRSSDKMKDGQKVIGSDGQPVKVITFGVAFPKPEFEAQIWPAMAAEAAKLFGGQAPQGFKYKYKDGDSPEAPYYNGKSGVPYNQRDGYPGHYVLTVSTELSAVSVMKWHNGAYHQIGANEIKTGDYVQMTLNLKAHAGQTPGLYVNPVLVLLCYEGDAISGSYDADPTQKFGAQPNIAPPPPGARQLGAPGQPMQQPQMGGGMPGMPGGAQMGRGMPGQTFTTPVQPQQMQQPAMQQGGMPMGGGMPMQQPQGQPMMQQPQGQPMMQQPQGNYPPPATDFIPGGQPQGMPMGGGMPGMPGPR